MDMNISMRDKKLLLMFLGVGIFACGYFFGYCLLYTSSPDSMINTVTCIGNASHCQSGIPVSYTHLRMNWA